MIRSLTGGFQTVFLAFLLIPHLHVPELLSDTHCAPIQSPQPIINCARSSPLIIGAGQGSTGTRSLANALGRFGLITVHYNRIFCNTRRESDCPVEHWRHTWLELLNLHPSKYHLYDYCKAFAPFDAVLDTPIPELLPFIYANHGNGSKVILTIRDSMEWVRHRASKFPRDLAPFGMTHAISAFNVRAQNTPATNARLKTLASSTSTVVPAWLYMAQIALVTCIVKRSDLLILNLWRESDSTAWMKLAAFLDKGSRALPNESFRSARADDNCTFFRYGDEYFVRECRTNMQHNTP